MGDDIIIWNTRDPLYGRFPAEFEAELKEKLAGKVEAAFFFGSYGTPDFDRDSDIDIFLVVETKKPFLERARDFTNLLDIVPTIDILVYTPEEFADLTSDPSPGFWKSAVASMRKFL